MRDLGVVAELDSPVGEGLRCGLVADRGRQPDPVGQQVLDFVEFLSLVRESGQHVEGLGQLAFLLQGLAAGQGQRANHRLPIRVACGAAAARCRRA